MRANVLDDVFPNQERTEFLAIEDGKLLALLPAAQQRKLARWIKRNGYDRPQLFGSYGW
ncbi:MAG: hypothetical protein QM811_29985 [Pirellulales bacterium]